jgi:hypothetical protein
MQKSKTRLVGWLVAAVVIIAAVAGIRAYESSQVRSGGLALVVFRSIADEVLAEAKLCLTEATGYPTLTATIAGGGETQIYGHAELDLRWAIRPQVKDSSEAQVSAFADATRKELQCLISNKEQVLRYYYPNLQMKVDVSTENSNVGGKPSVRVSLKCAN